MMDMHVRVATDESGRISLTEVSAIPNYEAHGFTEEIRWAERHIGRIFGRRKRGEGQKLTKKRYRFAGFGAYRSQSGRTWIMAILVDEKGKYSHPSVYNLMHDYVHIASAKPITLGECLEHCVQSGAAEHHTKKGTPVDLKELRRDTI